MNECEQVIEVAQIVTRGILLLSVSIGGILTIYFGWRLYLDAVTSKVTGEFTWSGLKIRLSASAPGVFLALFGCYLLYTVAQHRFESVTESIQQKPGKILYQSARGDTASSKLEITSGACERFPRMGFHESNLEQNATQSTGLLLTSQALQRTSGEEASTINKESAPAKDCILRINRSKRSYISGEEDINSKFILEQLNRVRTGLLTAKPKSDLEDLRVAQAISALARLEDIFSAAE